MEQGRLRELEEYHRRIAKLQPSRLSWTPKFSEHVHAAIAVTSVPERLKSGSAVVLERIAYGGGGTNWYFCKGLKELEELEFLLHAGSCVSFYFDDRIARGPYCAPEMKAIAASTTYPEHSFDLGALRSDGITINMIGSVDADDFIEYDEEWSSAPFVFYGDFPGRDNDGINAVTFDLPDSDGVLRRHPH